MTATSPMHKVATNGLDHFSNFFNLVGIQVQNGQITSQMPAKIANGRQAAQQQLANVHRTNMRNYTILATKIIT
jgi:hypothetical protein